jgi:hypothetical protein
MGLASVCGSVAGFTVVVVAIELVVSDVTVVVAGESEDAEPQPPISALSATQAPSTMVPADRSDGRGRDAQVFDGPMSPSR